MKTKKLYGVAIVAILAAIVGGLYLMGTFQFTMWTIWGAECDSWIASKTGGICSIENVGQAGDYKNNWRGDTAHTPLKYDEWQNLQCIVTVNVGSTANNPCNCMGKGSVSVAGNITRSGRNRVQCSFHIDSWEDLTINCQNTGACADSYTYENDVSNTIQVYSYSAKIIGKQLTTDKPKIVEYKTPKIYVEDRKIITEVYLENQGADMTENYLVEMQPTIQTLFTQLFVSSAKTCDANRPNNVHKLFKLNSGERAAIKLATSEKMLKGTWQIKLVSTKGGKEGCCVDSQGNQYDCKPVEPYEWGVVVGSIDVGKLCPDELLFDVNEPYDVESNCIYQHCPKDSNIVYSYCIGRPTNDLLIDKQQAQQIIEGNQYYPTDVPNIVEYRSPSVSVSGKTITVILYLENQGADMTSNYIVELQPVLKTLFGYSFISPQRVCEAGYAQNVHKAFKLNQNEKAEVKLVSEVEQYGKYDLKLVSVTGCCAYTDCQAVGPYEWEKIISTVDVVASELGGEQPAVEEKAEIVEYNDAEISVEDKTIYVTVYLKNVGADMKEKWLVELQPKRATWLGLFVGSQQTCDASTPQNVHKDFQLAASEKTSITLASTVDYGSYTLRLVSTTGCCATEGCEAVEPYAWGIDVGSATLQPPAEEEKEVIKEPCMTGEVETQLCKDGTLIITDECVNNEWISTGDECVGEEIETGEGGEEKVPEMPVWLIIVVIVAVVALVGMALYTRR